LTKNMEKGHLI